MTVGMKNSAGLMALTIYAAIVTLFLFVLYIFNDYGFTPLGWSLLIIFVLIGFIIYIGLKLKVSKKDKPVKKPRPGIIAVRNYRGHPLKSRMGIGPSYKTLLDRTVTISEEDPFIYSHKFQKGDILEITIYADEPLDFHLLDKWHCSRPDTWYDFDPRYQNIKRLTNERLTISKDGIWCLVFDTLEDNVDVKIEVIKIKKKKL